jgi:hypothetical protein
VNVVDLFLHFLIIHTDFTLLLSIGGILLNPKGKIMNIPAFYMLLMNVSGQRASGLTLLTRLQR